MEAVDICAHALASRLGISLNALIKVIWDKIHRELYLLITRALIDYDDSALNCGISDQTHQVIMMGYRDLSEQRKTDSTLAINMNTELELVGIGAPAHVFLENLAQSFNTSCTIPCYAPVANALGAVTGNILVEELVAIKPGFTSSGVDGYYCYSSQGRARFEYYEEACSWAQDEAIRIAEQTALSRGAADVTITVATEQNTYELPANYLITEIQDDDESLIDVTTDEPVSASLKKEKSNSVLLETIIIARAQGPVYK